MHRGESYDDTTRTVTTYDPAGTVTSTRPYDADENAAADLASIEGQRQAVTQTLAANVLTDEQKIEAAIAKLATLLGESTQAGSIRAIMGTTADAAGTTTLRALRAQSNTAVVNAASIKALLGLMIDLTKLMVDDAQATRRIARQELRLSHMATGNYASADVGVDI